MTTIHRLTLPPLSGGRASARRLVGRLASEHPIQDDVVVVDATHSEAAAPSFVDELCKALLLDARAASIQFVGTSDSLHRLAERSASQREIADRVQFNVPVPA